MFKSLQKNLNSRLLIEGLFVCSGVMVFLLSGYAAVFAQEVSDDAISDAAVEKMIEYVTKEVADERARLESLEAGASVNEGAEGSEAPLIEAPKPEAQTVSAQLVQGTSNVEDSVSATTLQNTSNPEAAGEGESNPEIIPLVPDTPTPRNESTALNTSFASSTNSIGLIPGPASLEVVDEAIEENTPVDPEAEPETVPAPPLIELSLEKNLEILAMTEPPAPPEPDFKFELTGKQIPTKRVAGARSTSNTGGGMPTVDNVEGIMKVSGACSDVYYVILLFKNESDYAKDPSSYVVNKAFLCIGGEYQYSLSELPASLKDGTYYLLVGEQSERGLWRPITDLTEVTINNTR